VILVDTSIWIDHLRRADPDLVALLDHGDVTTHPMVIGELALGSLHDRRAVLALLGNLVTTEIATHIEVLSFAESERLYNRGISLVDAHLLAAVRLTPTCRLWTRDKRLGATAHDLQVGWVPTSRLW
jgi:predicted nucleic acid-binding protein